MVPGSLLRFSIPVLGSPFDFPSRFPVPHGSSNLRNTRGTGQKLTHPAKKSLVFILSISLLVSAQRLFIPKLLDWHKFKVLFRSRIFDCINLTPMTRNEVEKWTREIFRRKTTARNCSG